MRYAIVEITTTGNVTIVPALAGKVVRVLSYVLTSNNNTNLLWKSSGGAAVSGTLYVGSHGGVAGVAGYQLPAGMFGLFETLPNEGLVLNNSSGNVGGHLTYNYISV